MLLSARMLNGVADVNHFETVATLEMTQGDIQDVYFVLIDASVEKTRDPAGRRYVAEAGASLQVTIQDIDSAVTVVKLATRPFAGDQSIWKVTLDPLVDAVSIPAICGTYALKLKLTEPGVPNPLPAAWANLTTYGLNDLVIFGAALWRSLQVGNLGNSPDVSPLWWVQMNIVPAKSHSGFVSHALSVARTTQEF